MSKLSQYNLGLFLTEKNSLDTWEKTGILSREIAPYNILANYFQKIFIFSYGDESDRRFQAQLAPNIEIVPRDQNLSLKKYNWLLPFRHWRKLKQCYFLKTNQFKSRAAVLAKLLRPWSKLVLRSGYTASLFQKQQSQTVGWKLRWWEKAAYRLCNMAVVTSAADRRYLIESYQIKPEKIKIIPNYIDTNLFKPGPPVRLEDRLIYVGRLHPQKNLLVLLEALAGTGLALDIAGAEKPGESRYKKLLMERAERLDVRLSFLGLVENEKLPATLNRYTIFVLPSLYEGLPKTLLEAMSCGLACVGTAVAGSQELIQHRQTGLLAQPSSASLKENILELIHDPDLVKTLGQRAREFVVKNFSLPTQIQKEISLYENLL